MREPADILRFGAFELDLRAGELRRNGIRVRLSPQPFKLLALLAAHPDALVTRDEIRRHLWGEQTYVEFDGSLSFCVNQVRAALGDDAASPRFVLTVPRRGYRFIAPVGAVRLGAPDADPGPAGRASHAGRRSVPPRRRHGLGGLAATAVLAVATLAAVAVVSRHPDADRRALVHLAVLPIVDLSPRPEPHLADGLTDALITQLARVDPKRLAVTARPSPGADQAGRAGDEKAVDYVLEGSVTRDADRARVRIRLARAGDKQEVWTDSFERRAASRDVLQQLVAARVARELDTRLLHIDPPGTQTTPARQAAIDAYLRAEQLLRRGDSWGASSSLTLFRRATDTDPAFAMAWVGQARAYAMLASSGAMRGTDALGPALEAARRAVALAPTRAEAHAALGTVLLYLDWDWAGGKRELETALELNPNLAIAHQAYAAYFSARGNHIEAIYEIRHALDMNPLDPAIVAEAGWYYYFARRYDEAIDTCRNLIALSGPSVNLLACIEVAHLGQGDAPQVIASRRNLLQAFGSPEVVLASFTDRLRREGLPGYHTWRFERAEAAARRGEFVPLVAAAPLAQLGRTDEALDWIDKALEIRDSAAIFLGVWPEFDPLRSDPRFVEKLRVIGLR